MFFWEFPQNIQNSYFFKKNLRMDVPYFIKENLWMSASNEAKLKKKIFGGSEHSSKLTLKTSWYYSCGCCDDSRLKKCVTDKHFEKKLDFEH